MASIKLKGDTSGEVTIQAPAVAGTTTLNLPATSSTLATQNALGVRNLIINGDMKIAQRGTSTTGLGNGDSGYYTIDRWRFHESGSPTSIWTMSQDTNVPIGQGFSNSLKMQCTTAETPVATGTLVHMRYRIEAQMLQHLKFGTSSAESLTLSFWVKSNKTGIFIIEFYQEDAVKVQSQSYTIDAADTWEKKTITIDGDTSGQIDNDNGPGLDIFFGLAAGETFTSGTLQTTWSPIISANRYVGQVNLADSTSNYINITGVQLEVGDTATPFEHRPYDMELARCQRYYWKQQANDSDNYFTDMGFAISTTQAFVYSQFPVTMRTSPTALEQSGTASHYRLTRFGFATTAVCSAVPTFQDATPNHAVSLFTVLSGLQSGYAGGGRSASTDAYLAWSAEL